MPDESTIWFDPEFESAAYDDNISWNTTDKNIIRDAAGHMYFDDDPQALVGRKAAKSAEIAAARYEAETGGCTVDGVTIATDRGSQALLTAAVVSARLDPEFKTRWKCADGHFVALDAFQLRAIGDAVIAHVEACFAREGELCEQIDAAQTPEELALIQWSL